MNAPWAAEQVSASGVAVSQDLVVAFVAGDRCAFRRLFEMLGRELFQVVSRYFHSPFDQEEAFQEAWLQLYRARAAFDVNRWEAFSGWAKQVARNRCLDLLKARRRTREVPVLTIESMQDHRPRNEQVQAVFDSRVRQALDRFVATLDDEQRAFFRACFVEERAHDDIARRLDISVRRSKYLKKKLLARLTACAPLREMGGS